MRPLNLFVSCLTIGVTTLAATAQDAPSRPRQDGDRPADRGGQPGERPGQPGRMQLSPEKAKAAQELTATGVAKRLNLNDDQTKAVVKAYLDARTSHADAAQKLREKMRDSGGGGGGGDPEERRARMQEMQKATEDMNKAERDKLQKALDAAIGAENATKASASLGVFAPNWDRMVDTIAEFKLEPKKQQEALNAIEDFIVAQSKITRAGDPQGGQDARREARQKLVAAMTPILSEEQLAKFEQATGGGRGRGGEGGDRPRRGGGGEGGGGGGGF